jgi:hypothetical protein
VLVFAKFFHEGDSFTVPNAGTCGQEAKPGIADEGWLELQKIKETSIDPPAIQDEDEVYAPNADTGRYELVDILEGSAKQTGTFTGQHLDALVQQLQFRTQKLTAASTVANPNAGSSPKGWLHIDLMDQHKTVIATVEIFVRLKLKNAIAYNSKHAQPQIEWTMLHSSLQVLGFES